MKCSAAQLLILLAAALAAGCDRHERAHASSSAARAAALPPPVSGSGSIAGRVRFVGSRPVLKRIDNHICGPDAAAIYEESVVVNSNGTLANVLIHLEGVPASDGSAAAASLLDQTSCRYVPHVLGMQVGQVLHITNSDATIHNVHMPADMNTAVNIGMAHQGDARDVEFRAAEIVRVRCDVHPWMNAFVGVFDHPFFSVTGSDGTFVIPRVPAGQYTLVAWHERYGEQRQDIQVRDGRADVEFTYNPQSLN